MQYMMLIHHDDEALAKAPPSLWGEYAAFNEALVKAGGTPGLRLDHSSKGRSVTLRNGKPELLDGPYADTKEQFAGYFMLDLPDIDAAVEWAARCPSAQYGTIEVRPIWPTREQ
ncbi:YciI family protein [Devosia sp.]|uniref:YciI family protein n=1 Tax=Devosia sp. TaxID=1871048 RepID=UPI002FC8F1B4